MRTICLFIIELIIFSLIVLASAGFAAGVSHIGLSILKGLGY